MERDFLADFLGVLERDLLDRLGVRGDDGDLNKKRGERKKKKKRNTQKTIIQLAEYSGATLHM